MSAPIVPAAAAASASGPSAPSDAPISPRPEVATGPASRELLALHGTTKCSRCESTLPDLSYHCSLRQCQRALCPRCREDCCYCSEQCRDRKRRENRTAYERRKVIQALSEAYDDEARGRKRSSVPVALPADVPSRLRLLASVLNPKRARHSKARLSAALAAVEWRALAVQISTPPAPAPAPAPQPAADAAATPLPLAQVVPVVAEYAQTASDFAQSVMAQIADEDSFLQTPRAASVGAPRGADAAPLDADHEHHGASRMDLGPDEPEAFGSRPPLLTLPNLPPVAGAVIPPSSVVAALVGAASNTSAAAPAAAQQSAAGPNLTAVAEMLAVQFLRLHSRYVRMLKRMQVQQSLPQPQRAVVREVGAQTEDDETTDSASSPSPAVTPTSSSSSSDPSPPAPASARDR